MFERKLCKMKVKFCQRLMNLLLFQKVSLNFVSRGESRLGRASAKHTVAVSDQGAEVIFDTVLKILENSGIDNAFLQRNLVAFCSGRASVTLGKTSGVGTRLKSKFSNLLLWHCLNQRL